MQSRRNTDHAPIRAGRQRFQQSTHLGRNSSNNRHNYRHIKGPHGRRRGNREGRCTSGCVLSRAIGIQTKHCGYVCGFVRSKFPVFFYSFCSAKNSTKFFFLPPSSNFHHSFGVARHNVHHIFTKVSGCASDGDTPQEVELAIFFDSTQKNLTVLSWSEDWQIRRSSLVPLICSHQKRAHELSNYPNLGWSFDCGKPCSHLKILWTARYSSHFRIPSQKLLPMLLVHQPHANLFQL